MEDIRIMLRKKNPSCTILLIILFVVFSLPSWTLSASAAIQIEADPDTNNTITMMAPDNISIDPEDNNWTLTVTDGTVAESVNAGDLIITGLPDGLTAEAEKGTENSINITVINTAYEPVLVSVPVEIIIKGSAVTEADAINSEVVTVSLLPAAIQVTGNADTDNSVTMAENDNVTIEPEDNTWTLTVTSRTVAATVYTTDLVITGLPSGLTASARKGIGNSIVVIVSGTASTPVLSTIPVQIIIKGSAVNEERALDSTAIPVSIRPGSPYLLNKEPCLSGQWFDESSLFPKVINEIDSATRYFLRLTFRDINNSLNLGVNALYNLRLCQIYSEGGSQVSMVDYDVLDYINRLEGEARSNFIQTYILVKDTANETAYLYIPIKQLRPQTTYSIFINPDIVEYVGGNGNAEVSWSITTMTVPAITGISVSSVSEDYDEDEPIIIKGDYFYSGGNIAVKFNDISAEDVILKTESDGELYLEVFLPGGNDRLKPGIYNITISNSSNYSETLYGQFSIIKASENPVPAEGERVIYSGSSSKVIETVSASADTIILKSRFLDRRYIDLDLDELMGDDVLVRKIIFAAHKDDSIREFNTTSRWADIRLYDLRLSSDYSREDIELRLGRVEPVVKNSLRSKLANAAIKSDFIEVQGENCTMDKVDLRIPFTNSDGNNLKVLRYDESIRNWYELPCKVNFLDSVVEFSSIRPGIFVVVE